MDLVNQFLNGPISLSTKASNVTCNPKRIYVTMLTNDSFYPGVKALSISLSQTCGNNYIFVIMITPDVSITTQSNLKKIGVIKLVDSISLKQPTTLSDQSWRGTELTKLNLWTLIEYHVIVYIDADCIVCDDLDSLFDLSTTFAAAPDIFPPDKFNAGVLVIQPSMDVFNDMLLQADKLVSYDDGDTGFLNAYFHTWYSSEAYCRLPFAYNAQRTLFWFTYKKNSKYWESIRPLKVSRLFE
jgi:glycogenin glucosyltransferase